MPPHCSAPAISLSHEDAVWADLAKGTPTFWVNANRSRAISGAQRGLGLADVMAAEARWRRFSPVLAHLFPDSVADGVIESPVIPVQDIVSKFLSGSAPPSDSVRMFVKADHALPIAGSVKARGGIYEVLCVAERIALAEGILTSSSDDYRKLLEPKNSALLGRYKLVVASTGNLGYAVGTVGRAFGFNTVVHMSRDAKAWKKSRLRALGASVIEHATDYTSAVTAAREDATGNARAHFVDDERSLDLFLGYSCAGLRLLAQLRQLQIEISDSHPLCVYLPCGVGGAPGGILFGLRALLGESVLGFFAEPTASPCMLLRLMGRLPPGSSVYDLGLDNHTEADGLAVARASELVASLIGDQVTAAYTVSDADLLRWVAALYESKGLRLEPSAAAGFPGALKYVWESAELQPRRHALANATHVVWTTGGSLVPDAEFESLLNRAKSF